MGHIKKSLLLVDDEPDNLQLLAWMLENDYNLELAGSGKQCLELIRKEKPDAVLLDINMPKMSGFEVCQCIKSDPETRDIPVVFISALVLDDDKRRGYKLGAADYLTKPLDESQLCYTLSELFQ